MTGPRRAAATRPVHPLAWWVWALSLAVAASRTTNPLLLGLIVVTVGYVVSLHRVEGPGARIFGVFVRIGLVVIGIRVLLFAFFAGTPGNDVIVTLPQLHLPAWLAGLRVGGPITAEGLLSASYDGLRLAAILCCVGAANAVTSPKRLLRSLPAALYEAGVAVTVALSVAPQAVVTLNRLRTARRLRGHSTRGWSAVRGLLVPTLEGSLDSSLELAAAMDARGFGRRGRQSRTSRAFASAGTVAGLGTIAASSYGLVVDSAPRLLGWPLLCAGAAILAVTVFGSARGGRTRHRPDHWRVTESVLAAGGVAAVVLMSLAPPEALSPLTDPPAAPPLPVAAALGIAAAFVAGVLTPRRARAAPKAVAGPVASTPIHSPAAEKVPA